METGRAAPFLSPEDKEALSKAANETLAWLESHPTSSVQLEELKEKTRNLESVYNPIFTAAYAKCEHVAAPSAEGGAPGDATGEGDAPGAEGGDEYKPE